MLDIVHTVTLLSCLFDKAIKARVTRLGVPRVRAAWGEHFLDFLQRLVAGFGVCEIELNGSEHTQRPKDEKQAPFDILEPGGDVCPCG